MGALSNMIGPTLREVVSLALEGGWINKLLQTVRKATAPQQNAATQFCLMHGVASNERHCTEGEAGADADTVAGCKQSASPTASSAEGDRTAATCPAAAVASAHIPSNGTLIPPADVPVIVGSAANVCSICGWGWLPHLHPKAELSASALPHSIFDAVESEGTSAFSATSASTATDFLSQRERALMCLTELSALCRSTGDRDGFLRALTGSSPAGPLGLGLGIGHGHGWNGRGQHAPSQAGNATGSADAPVACLVTVLADRMASAREVSAALELLASMVEWDASGVRAHVLARKLHPAAAPIGVSSGASGAVAAVATKLTHRDALAPPAAAAGEAAGAHMHVALVQQHRHADAAARMHLKMRLVDDGRSIRLWEKLHALGKPYCYYEESDYAGGPSSSSEADESPAPTGTCSVQRPVAPGDGVSAPAKLLHPPSPHGSAALGEPDYLFACGDDGVHLPCSQPPFVARAAEVGELRAFNTAGKDRGEHGVIVPRPPSDKDRPAAASTSVLHALVWRAVDDPEPAIQVAAIEILRLLCTGESTAPGAAAGAAAQGVSFATAQEREAFLQALYDHYAGWLAAPFSAASVSSPPPSASTSAAASLGGAAPSHSAVSASASPDPSAAMEFLLIAVGAAVRAQVEAHAATAPAETKPAWSSPHAALATAVGSISPGVAGSQPHMSSASASTFNRGLGLPLGRVASTDQSQAHSHGLRIRVDARSVLTPAVRRRMVAALQPDTAPVSRTTARHLSGQAHAANSRMSVGCESPMSRSCKASLLELFSAFIRSHSFRIKYLALTSHLMAKVARLCRYQDMHMQLSALRFLRGVLMGKDDFYLKSIGKPVFADIMACFIRSGGSAGHSQQAMASADDVRPGRAGPGWFPPLMSASASRAAGSFGAGAGAAGDVAPRAPPLGAGPVSLLRSACLDLLDTLARSSFGSLISQTATAYKPLLLLVRLIYIQGRGMQTRSA